jgi:hypothetical protein
MQNFIKLPLLALACLELTGCAALVAPEYSPNYEVIDKVRKIEAQLLAVGQVQPVDPEAKVNRISLRASSLKSSTGTFAKYLENALISDLKEMGFYDPSSASRIDLTILQNDIDISGLSEGKGVLEASLKVVRDGAVKLEKTYTATTQFESSFAGAVAIPKGQSEYPNLVRKFLAEVYSDPAFIEAIRK